MFHELYFNQEETEDCEETDDRKWRLKYYTAASRADARNDHTNQACFNPK